jgi:hypothetical protein
MMRAVTVVHQDGAYVLQPATGLRFYGPDGLEDPHVEKGNCDDYRHRRSMMHGIVRWNRVLGPDGRPITLDGHAVFQMIGKHGKDEGLVGIKDIS